MFNFSYGFRIWKAIDYDRLNLFNRGQLILTYIRLLIRLWYERW